ncbi:hypothetical protein RFI_10120 [Reticulomyxa filosa]|uniref:Dynein regulatory complex protein 1/2 N-terminal domain-containing protein n=1 Tax=Reticulomyxa filosa TaxID=46433 RepID=X6NNQ9_RETFI|nr:hypothetical protein RFI_10120 [Reticulomyxa filosa]|eukprot:ETO27012.1 hypothetical protein RFI_10120 [Reticulomyxa filosa]
MDTNNKVLPTKEERIASRWSRVQARLKAIQEEAQPKPSNELEKEKEEEKEQAKTESEPKQQIKKSRDIIESIAQEVWESVSDIEKMASITEANRRARAQKEYEERIVRYQQQVDKGAAQSEELKKKWESLKTTNITPEELYNEILKNKSASNTLMDSYKDLQKTEMTELKVKSEEFVQMLKEQENDIANVIWRMHKMLKALQDELRMQLVEIEKSFLQERHQLDETQQMQIDTLLRQKRIDEFKMFEGKITNSQMFEKELEKVRSEDKETYNQLKVRLENQIQLLEQQLEEMRAIYQLNNEKLNYNFQILKEREKENTQTVEILKRKEKKLKERVVTLREKYETQNRTFQCENKELTEEYKRIAKRFKDLQKKFKHFQDNDNAKYQHVT